MAKKATDKPGAGAKKRYSFSRAVTEEGDPEWRNWFAQVARLRKDIKEKRKKPVFSSFEKEGESKTVFRKRTDPIRVDKFIKKDAKKSGRAIQADLELVESAWSNAVGQDIAGESAVFAFKNGVLTVSIFSQTLLQEIRQFHQDTILRELREAWQSPMPLVKVMYKPGKR